MQSSISIGEIIHSSSFAKLGLIGFLLAGFIVLTMAIILIVILLKKAKKRKIAISAECAKIDQMQAAGKVSRLEAEELKKAVGYIPRAMEKQNPDIHIRLVAFFHLGLLLIITIIITAIVLPRVQHEPAFGVHVAALSLLALPLIFFCACLLAAIGLLKLKNWVRYLVIVLALLEIWTFPLGTALGLYSLWVLLIRDGAAEYFTGQNEVNA